MNGLARTVEAEAVRCILEGLSCNFGVEGSVFEQALQVYAANGHGACVCNTTTMNLYPEGERMKQLARECMGQHSTRKHSRTQ